MYDRAIKINPNLADAYYNKGYSFLLFSISTPINTKI